MPLGQKCGAILKDPKWSFSFRIRFEVGCVEGEALQLQLILRGSFVQCCLAKYTVYPLNTMDSQTFHNISSPLATVIGKVRKERNRGGNGFSQRDNHQFSTPIDITDQ